MKFEQPTFAYSIQIQNSVDGPHYSVFMQAYGLEMTMDDEWPTNTLVFAPPHHVEDLTNHAEVNSMGAIPGASYPPGNGDYKQISDHGGHWVMARPNDNLQTILDNKLGVLLYLEFVDDIDSADLPDGLDDSNFILAFRILSTSTIESAQQDLESLRAKFDGRFANCHVLISGSFEHSNLLEYAKIPSANGLLLLDAHSGEVVELIEEFVAELET